MSITYSVVVLSVILTCVTSQDESQDIITHNRLSARLPSSVSYYPSRRDTPQSSLPEEDSATLRLPGVGPGGVGTKPTKYHYYPHNQHIYLLPECAVQQVCNAVYVRLNYTQPLCACSGRYREPCSASLNSDDLHTTELSADPKGKILTLVKTCEPVSDMRLCRSPRDWSLLALQNIRTGKSHYLVICRCPKTSVLEGPMSHDQPAYASVPGIRVYGMMCVNQQAQGRVPTTGSTAGQGRVPTTVSTSTSTLSSTLSSVRRRGRPLRIARNAFKTPKGELPPFPWDKVKEVQHLVMD